MRRSGALNEGRSLNSGDTMSRGPHARPPSALNEGRSLNSGDTGGGLKEHQHMRGRSTKAGA